MQHNKQEEEKCSNSCNNNNKSGINSQFSATAASPDQQQQQQQQQQPNNRTATTNSFYDYRCVLSEMLFARLSFLPSLTYNMVLDKLGYRRWYDRIDKTVILGALPLTPKAKQLINEENISAVISMNENYELKLCYGPNEWNACNVSFLQLPIVDLFEAPSQDKLEKGVAFIYKNAVSNASVYVHCKAGRTRSATLVGCYLMLRYNLNPDEAVTLLKEKRPHIFLKEKQLNAMQEFYDKHIKGKK